MKKVNKKQVREVRRQTAQSYQNSHLAAVLISLAISAVLLTALASHSSFLYLFNDAEETGMLFTVGKSMFAGWVPYQDLFDQQGFLLYCIYALASLISSTSMIGVWVMEAIFLFMTGLWIWKFGRLFVSSLYSLGFTVLSMAFLSMSTFYATGGSASAFALPCIAYTLYNAAKLFRSEQTSGADILFAGLAGGICFFITPVYTGLWLAYLLLVVLRGLFRKEWLQALLSIVWFVMGAAVPVLLVMVYFIANSALASLIELYFKYNWQTMADLDFFQRFVFAYEQVKDVLLTNYVLSAGLIVSLLSFLYLKSLWSYLLIVLGFAATAATTFFSGYTADSLFLGLLLFALPGFLLPFWLIQLGANKLSSSGWLTVLVILASLASAGWFVYEGNDWQNVWNRKRVFAVNELAKLIEESEDRTLLNYGMLDQGLYLAADVLPATYYFQLPYAAGSANEAAINSQNSYIENGTVQFVLTAEKEGETSTLPESLEKNYQVLETITEMKGTQEWKYTLWQKKTAENPETPESSEDTGTSTSESTETTEENTDSQESETTEENS